MSSLSPKMLHAFLPFWGRMLVYLSICLGSTRHLAFIASGLASGSSCLGIWLGLAAGSAVNPTTAHSTLKVVSDKGKAFVYRSNKLTFQIKSSSIMKPGDRIVIEFDHPYNNILVFRAKCEETTGTADLYCVPFLKYAPNSFNLGLYVFTLTK